MAELTISSDEIRSAIANYTSSYSAEASREEVGVVISAADGIAQVSGLPSVMANELLEFPGGVIGVAQNLDTDRVGVVVLGNYESLKEGDEVKRTGEVLSIPVGDKFLGRVINPLGQPIDGLGAIEAEVDRVLELQAPSVLQRQPVEEPMQTGIKAIDAMTPIGRGQRQLIIGDRKTGKTAVCIDTILNQRANWESGDKKKYSGYGIWFNILINDQFKGMINQFLNAASGGEEAGLKLQRLFWTKGITTKTDEKAGVEFITKIGNKTVKDGTFELSVATEVSTYNDKERLQVKTYLVPVDEKSTADDDELDDDLDGLDEDDDLDADDLDDDDDYDLDDDDDDDLDDDLDDEDSDLLDDDDDEDEDEDEDDEAPF